MPTMKLTAIHSLMPRWKFSPGLSPNGKIKELYLS
jgi:hypothetical protein